MTKRDFEMLASVLARRESEIEELKVSDAERLACRFAHRRTVMSLSNELDNLYPRFKRGVFEAAALPIYSANRVEAIRNSLSK